jgi:small conductance mechanosensitive channel
MNFSRRIITAFTFAANLFLIKFAYCQTAENKGIFEEEIDTARKFMDMIIEFVVKYSFQVLGGLVVLIIGFVVANIAAKFVNNFLKKKGVDVTVAKFTSVIAKIIIVAFAAIVALGKFGITIAPFIAGLSVVGFGTSFALQGPLSNYASGLTLIFTKPFKVGDIIEVTGVMGEVQDMTLARTLIKTVDGNLIVVPNKQIIGEIIHNYSDFKKLDLTVGVSYDSDIDKVLDTVREIVKSDNRVVDSPQAKIGISEFADSSINIYARLWCRQSDYWDVKFDLNKKIHGEFKSKNIAIPFPQRDVHLFNKA